MLNHSEIPNCCGAEGEDYRGEPDGVFCQREAGHMGPHRNGESEDHCIEWGPLMPSEALLRSLEMVKRAREAA